MWLLAQAIDAGVTKTVGEALKDATGLRPSEFLMALLAVVSIALILRHLSKREEKANETVVNLTAAHAAAMSAQSAKLDSTVTTFNETVLKVNRENNVASKERADDCHRQGNEMIKAIAVVSEMARDVKEVSQIVVAQTEQQRAMLEAQGKLLHDQRGVMQAMQSLAEATMMRLAQVPAVQHHEVELKQQVKQIEE